MPAFVSTEQALIGGDGIESFLIGLGIGAVAAHDIRDEHIELDGKIEQDYAFEVGGRLGYIWNEAFMSYFGAGRTRTKVDGHVNVHIADPLCGGPEGHKLCNFVSHEFDGVTLVNMPTDMRLDIDQDVDGYKLLIGGEYLLGYNWGGNWFLRGQAEYQDYDGFSKAFSGQQNKQVFSSEDNCWYSRTYGAKCKPSIDVARVINESGSVNIDKEDYNVHAALVYKFSAAPVALAKPMK